MSSITIGLDLAKNVFQVHGADAGGCVVFRKKNFDDRRSSSSSRRCRPASSEWRLALQRITGAVPYRHSVIRFG